LNLLSQESVSFGKASPFLGMLFYNRNMGGKKKLDYKRKASKLTEDTEDRYLLVAQLYSNGNTFPQISAKMNISDGTIRSAFRLLREKHGGNNTAHLLCLLIRNRLIK
jgi:DNA-binding NarL/FixJ family response regulator